jgi:hypothetical protein
MCRTRVNPSSGVKNGERERAEITALRGEGGALGDMRERDE